MDGADLETLFLLLLVFCLMMVYGYQSDKKNFSKRDYLYQFRAIRGYYCRLTDNYTTDPRNLRAIIELNEGIKKAGVMPAFLLYICIILSKPRLHQQSPKSRL
ncbi:MAG TPA: hypothetical protein VK528_04020 [Flavobacterium sp.]|nr:hypothetical protein [Flavobacterium sp.]